MKKCVVCGCDFAPKNKNQKFCSYKCRDRHYYEKKQNRNIRQSKCIECGKDMIIHDYHKTSQKFCSPQCRNSYALKHNPATQCEVCGNYFVPLRKNHICCSDSCRKNFYRCNEIKECIVCGKKFKSTINTKFCSHECKKQNIEYEDKICIACGAKYESKRANQKYCSVQCKKKSYQIKTQIVQCKYCKKMFDKSIYEISDNNFCSHRCSGLYYSDFYRKQLFDRLKNGKMVRAMTSPHLAINEVLNHMGVEYENEKTFDKYCCDIYLTGYDLIIEIMGSYWHCDKRLYPKGCINEIQSINVERDKRKDKKIKQKYGIHILYLWEYDIKYDIEKCKNIIELYIKNKGDLEFYNSFDY